MSIDNYYDLTYYFGILSFAISYIIKAILKKNKFKIRLTFPYVSDEIKNFKKICQENKKLNLILVSYYVINILFIISFLLTIYVSFYTVFK